MRRLLILIVLLSAASSWWVAAVSADHGWKGVDETVVERFAEQANRPARAPLINTDKGDLLLFVFLVAGAAGGFAAGYYYRELFGKNRCEQEK